VNQPINSDGSSNFPAKRGVIPVSFSLFTAPGAPVFQSIGSDGYSGFPGVGTGSVYANDCSYLSFTPTNTSLTFSQLTTLVAVYNFTTGNCHGGSLRWSIVLANGAVIKIYYGGDSQFWIDCKSTGAATNQSGLNMINANFDGQLGGDKRYETTASGGSYVKYADALAFAQAQNSPVASVILALDSRWQQTDGTGDQILTLENVQVITSLPTNDTFSPLSGGATQTCTLPAAQILVNKTSGLDQGSVNEVLSVSGADASGYFRVVDCKCIYNLAVSPLPGAGGYSVSAQINGTLATNPAIFMLK